MIVLLLIILIILFDGFSAQLANIEKKHTILPSGRNCDRDAYEFPRDGDNCISDLYFPVYHVVFIIMSRHNQQPVSRAVGVIRRYCNQLWIFCGDYAFRVFDKHPRGKRDIVEDQSKVELLPPMCTITFIYDILKCLK